MITMAQETLLFRWAGFSPALWLLIPAFSLDTVPPDLAVYSFNTISTLLYHSTLDESNAESMSSVICLSPVTFSAQDLLMSELLRTL